MTISDFLQNLKSDDKCHDIVYNFNKLMVLYNLYGNEDITIDKSDGHMKFIIRSENDIKHINTVFSSYGINYLVSSNGNIITIIKQ